MKKQFKWQELSTNGLLGEVRKGTNYCGFDVEIGGPWDSEEEAVAALAQFKADHDVFYSSDELVLLTVYRIGR